jgi:hypothetical protein
MFLLAFPYFTLLISILLLAQNEMFPLYDCQDFRGVYGL